MYRIIINSRDGLRKRKSGGKEIALKSKRTLRGKVPSALLNNFLKPFYAGIAGFASFLFIIMIIELIAYGIGISESLNIGITQVMIAALGFVLQFVYELMGRWSKK